MTARARPEALNEGESFEIFVDVTNIGKVAATAELRISFPPELRVEGGGERLTFPVGAGGREYRTFKVGTTRPGEFRPKVLLSYYDEHNHRIDEPPLTTTILVAPKAARLEASLAVERVEVEEGEKVTFSYHILNTGNDDAREISLEVPRHEAIEVLKEPKIEDRVEAGKDLRVVGLLSFKDGGMFTLGPCRVTGRDSKGNELVAFTNQLNLHVKTRAARIELSKEYFPLEVFEGDEVQANVTIVNMGNDEALEVEVRDLLPQGAVLTAGEATWLGTLLAGSKEVLSYSILLTSQPGPTVADCSYKDRKGRPFKVSSNLPLVPTVKRPEDVSAALNVSRTTVYEGDEVLIEVPVTNRSQARIEGVSCNMDATPEIFLRKSVINPGAVSSVEPGSSASFSLRVVASKAGVGMVKSSISYKKFGRDRQVQLPPKLVVVERGAIALRVSVEVDENIIYQDTVPVTLRVENQGQRELKEVRIHLDSSDPGAMEVVNFPTIPISIGPQSAFSLNFTIRTRRQGPMAILAGVECKDNEGNFHGREAKAFSNVVLPTPKISCVKTAEPSSVNLYDIIGVEVLTFNEGSRGVKQVALVDSLSPAFERLGEATSFQDSLQPGSKLVLRYKVRPLRQGSYTIGGAKLFYEDEAEMKYVQESNPVVLHVAYVKPQLELRVEDVSALLGREVKAYIKAVNVGKVPVRRLSLGEIDWPLGEVGILAPPVEELAPGGEARFEANLSSKRLGKARMVAHVGYTGLEEETHAMTADLGEVGVVEPAQEVEAVASFNEKRLIEGQEYLWEVRLRKVGSAREISVEVVPDDKYLECISENKRFLGDLAKGEERIVEFRIRTKRWGDYPTPKTIVRYFDDAGGSPRELSVEQGKVSIWVKELLGLDNIVRTLGKLPETARQTLIQGVMGQLVKVMERGAELPTEVINLVISSIPMKALPMDEEHRLQFYIYVGGLNMKAQIYNQVETILERMKSECRMKKEDEEKLNHFQSVLRGRAMFSGRYTDEYLMKAWEELRDSLFLP